MTRYNRLDYRNSPLEAFMAVEISKNEEILESAKRLGWTPSYQGIITINAGANSHSCEVVLFTKFQGNKDSMRLLIRKKNLIPIPLEELLPEFLPEEEDKLKRLLNVLSLPFQWPLPQM